MIHTSEKLYAALRNVIGNLPSQAIEIDIHLEPREIPVMTVKSHLTGPDGHPVVGKGPGGRDVLAVTVERFEIVPAGTISADARDAARYRALKSRDSPFTVRDHAAGRELLSPQVDDAIDAWREAQNREGVEK